MAATDYEAFFQDYVQAFNQSLVEDASDFIRASYAEYFVSAGVGEAVQGGANDEKYADILRKGAEFYRALGFRKMSLLEIEVTPIDEGHDMARPFFRADYVRRDGTPVSIDFDLVYMLQKRADGPKIFAFVAGDEIALYRKYGLVDESGKPA
ncbi:nuclear transport factor 2 family protein [Mesorhizobium sp. SB112]|uniref:nuclear transport factor 2 family protein n=1 Tax=Mesorhizobium sp. SB112 TaxID=3151853 RepID=UPI003266F677